MIRVLGRAAILLPITSYAQQMKIPIVGYLHSGSAGPLSHEATSFRTGLNEGGYVEGQNIIIEYRWAEGHSDALPRLAADLVSRNVTVIAAIGGDNAALAAKNATSTIPIVFQIGSDPVKAGLVTRLNHPGANITGLSLFVGTLDPKRLEFLHELVPQAKTIAVLTNPLVAESEARLRDLSEVAQKLGLKLMSFSIKNDQELNTAFEAMTANQANSVLVFGSPFFDSRPDQIVALAAHHKIPASYAWREFVIAGGLMSYGTNLSNASRETGIYVARILKGENPSDLPVQQPAKFELVINLKTARTLGLSVPQGLLARADEIIE